MEKHMYKIDMSRTATYMQQNIECKTEGIGDTKYGYQLVTFETKKENYCVAKYISQAYPATPNKEFLIGLKAETSDSLRNAFLWDDKMQEQIGYDATNEDADMPTFTNWVPTSPTGLDCVKLDIGSGTHGLWVDVDCATPRLSICEKYPLNV